jgi:Na+/H+ antiporter NhaD/arsenite permease-like protein
MSLTFFTSLTFMSSALAPHMPFSLDPMWVSLAVLALTYAFIIAGPFNRAVVALIGAVVLVLIGALDQDEAIKGIDWNTIGLLAGMMILVSISRRSGLFQYLAIASAQRVKANPAGILLMLQLATAILSAVLNNVSTVLLIVPVTLVIAEELELPPFPFLFAEVFASNVGGTATLIGDPPNILIGSQAGLDFNAFLANAAPVAVVIMVVQVALVHLLWGRTLRASPESRVLVMGMNAPGMVTDWVLLRRSVVVLGAVLVAFVFAGPLGLQPATIALAGAAVLMLLDNLKRAPKQADNVHATLAEIEWTTIFFFIGLFVVVHAVERSGLLALLGGKLVALTGGNLAAAGALILWVSAVLSAILDNIPFVATMIPLIKGMAPAFGGPNAIEPLWWCLALGACLGGNGTLTGASANLAVAGIAERNGIRFGFVQYLRYGVPMTLISIAICQLYVWLRYF